jgi:hypothetical protein
MKIVHDRLSGAERIINIDVRPRQPPRACRLWAARHPLLMPAPIHLRRTILVDGPGRMGGAYELVRNPGKDGGGTRRGGSAGGVRGRRSGTGVSRSRYLRQRPLGVRIRMHQRARMGRLGPALESLARKGETMTVAQMATTVAARLVRLNLSRRRVARTGTERPAPYPAARRKGQASSRMVVLNDAVAAGDTSQFAVCLLGEPTATRPASSAYTADGAPDGREAVEADHHRVRH